MALEYVSVRSHFRNRHHRNKSAYTARALITIHGVGAGSDELDRGIIKLYTEGRSDSGENLAN